MNYFMKTDFSEWDLKKAIAIYLEQNEFATAKRRMVDDLHEYIKTPNRSRKSIKKAEDLLASLKKNPVAIKPTNNKQSAQASTSAAYTDSVVNLHSSIKNQNITINQDYNMTSASSDEVREVKRQKISVSDLSTASATTAQIEKENRDEIDDLFNPAPISTISNMTTEQIDYDRNRISNRLVFSAWRFRHDVYALGVKKLNSSLTDSDKESLANMITVFEPNNLGEELDMFSARLIIDIDLENSMEVNVLKLSLSRIVNTVNIKILSIFKKYILTESFWAEIDSLGVNQPPGLPSDLKSLVKKIVEDSKDEKGQLILKELRINVITEKLKAVKDDDEQLTIVLDILDSVIRSLIVDPRNPIKNETEMTSYRKVAMILDLIFKDSGIDLIDGETTCKASKVIAKNHEDIFGDNIPLNRGFGRRIDLLVSSKNIELSTNEWKRKKITLELLLTQQTKNIRMNKAILSKLSELIFNKNDLDKVYTMSMDWVGPKGYIFAIKKVSNIYVAVDLKPLSMPEYLFQLPDFVETLDALYSWKCHQTQLEEIVLPAAISKESNSLFSRLNNDSSDNENMKVGSPNVYLTPTKTKKK